MAHPGAAMYVGMLTAPEARTRLEGIARWTEYGAGPYEIVALLDDPAPVPQPHAGRVFLVEVRARALVALQDHYRRGRRPWDLGPVRVRAGMPADEAGERAAALAPERRRSVLATAERFLAERVRPFDRDRAACLAYAVLLQLGEVAYETQEVGGRTWLTPLQEAVHASQMRSPRPVPHLRFDGARGPVGYVYRAGSGWVLDFDESPEAAEIAAAVRLWRGVERGGVPRVLHDEAGRPLRNGRALVLDGVVPDGTPDPVAWLRSLAAAVEGRHPARLVL
ncbi:hypothetical protein [Nonomuraea sp. NPDC048826]|uniref:hypothetical protein n=1 Tax=Nonomuraea sp. NPDC048826 TaxID=3364347 RepID=UPI00371EEB7D